MRPAEAHIRYILDTPTWNSECINVYASTFGLCERLILLKFKKTIKYLDRYNIKRIFYIEL